MARVRVRQHVNPLSHKYQVRRTPPNWEEIYAQPAQPLHLDIGCARGRFLLKMAQLEPDWNFLGLEIREPLVEEGNEGRDRADLQNLHYFFCNVNIDLDLLLESLPSGVLQAVTIQFPDPWFKKRHEKRRTVQPELVNTLARYAIAGGKIFLQSDVEAVARQMHRCFSTHPDFCQVHLEPWLETNPLPVPTEREIATLGRNGTVYRSLFVKSRRSLDK
ncbi:MAG: tRNA (guanosine(46)-N7)-methyltransferase TrmB [Cyanobacteriota bacterium]|nr:tRNA (guanosine(46)-N7)-methyltransferase TrmB [Cyanobacteriota bacterium]